MVLMLSCERSGL